MQNHILKNGISVNVKKSTRARRVIIKVRHGNAELVIPKRASVRRALKFLDSKEDWILERLRATPKKIRLYVNVQFPLFGESHKIIYGGLRGRAEIFDNQLVIYGDILTVNKKVRKLLHEKLLGVIKEIAVDKAKELDVNYKKISLRDNISRWGSCSNKGTLSFCWRLVFAPYEVVEYLVCHELSHLKEMNHSTKFWAVVAALYPNYRHAESWLKKNGNSLYLYE